VFRFGGAVMLVLAALAAGCGGGDEESAASTDWADGVCTALATWGDSIKSVTDDVTSSDSSKDRVQKATANVKEATDTLADDLQDLGRPGTESGEQAQDALEKLATGLRQDLAKIEDAADGDSAAAAAATISSSLASMSGRIGTALNELEQLDAEGELSDAFEEADACQDLANSTT
jgi:uncharacterized phage infection (PIP) family protein YhgE